MELEPMIKQEYRVTGSILVKEWKMANPLLSTLIPVYTYFESHIDYLWQIYHLYRLGMYGVKHKVLGIHVPMKFQTN